MSCSKISRKHRQVCIGSLDTQIILNNRAITEPIEDEVDYTENFTPSSTVWANVMTSTKGEIIFDGTNIARVVSHLFHIRFLTGITAQTWIELRGINYDILNSDDLDERDEFILLKATKRGIATLSINQQ